MFTCIGRHSAGAFARSRRSSKPAVSDTSG